MNQAEELHFQTVAVVAAVAAVAVGKHCRYRLVPHYDTINIRYRIIRI